MAGVLQHAGSFSFQLTSLHRRCMFHLQCIVLWLLGRVTFCTVDSRNDKIVSFIAQSPDTASIACYAFLCNSKSKVRGAVCGNWAFPSSLSVSSPAAMQPFNYLHNDQCLFTLTLESDQTLLRQFLGWTLGFQLHHSHKGTLSPPDQVWDLCRIRLYEYCSLQKQNFSGIHRQWWGEKSPWSSQEQRMISLLTTKGHVPWPCSTWWQSLKINPRLLLF